MDKLRDTFFLVLVVIAANSCSPNQEKLTELETNSNLAIPTLASSTFVGQRTLRIF